MTDGPMPTPVGDLPRPSATGVLEEAPRAIELLRDQLMAADDGATKEMLLYSLVELVDVYTFTLKGVDPEAEALVRCRETVEWTSMERHKQSSIQTTIRLGMLLAFGAALVLAL